MAQHIKAARWYAKHGWYVLPLHEPQFSDGKLTGCSCESWRRENIDPDYQCATPGKHPRHSSWEEVATTDVAQIERWWKAWPNANIGIASGKSGLLCVDADTYKEGGELSTAEKQTVTSLTGGGGEHLIYRHPNGGPDLGNATGGLPGWIDIRGHGGQFVAPPSLHPSGKRYQWEGGFGPHEIDPLPVPGELQRILTEAAEAAGERILLGNMEAVTLGDLQLPNWTEALLRGDRSRIDACVITALVRAGATDGQIYYLYEHYAPTDKYAMKNGQGKKYLELSISNARAFLATRQRPELEPQASAA